MPLDIHSQFDKPDFQFCTKQQTCDETLIIFLPNSKHVANPTLWFKMFTKTTKTKLSEVWVSEDKRTREKLFFFFTWLQSNTNFTWRLATLTSCTMIVHLFTVLTICIIKSGHWNVCMMNMLCMIHRNTLDIHCKHTASHLHDVEVNVASVHHV